MTKDEFERGYAAESGCAVEELRGKDFHVSPCECGEEGCNGWRMQYVSASRAAGPRWEYLILDVGLNNKISEFQDKLDVIGREGRERVLYTGPRPRRAGRQACVGLPGTVPPVDVALSILSYPCNVSAHLTPPYVSLSALPASHIINFVGLVTMASPPSITRAQ